MENAGDFAILISSVISSKTLFKQSTGKLKTYENQKRYNDTDD